VLLHFPDFADEPRKGAKEGTFWRTAVINGQTRAVGKIMDSSTALMPIKIQCGCGQKYAFDVEPLAGRMGYAVQCPVCGADGTAAANQLIAQHVGTEVTSSLALRFGRQQSPPVVQTPRNLAGAARAAASPATKVRNKWLVPAMASIIGLVLVV